MNAHEFYAFFEPSFARAAAAAGLQRARGKSLKWTRSTGDGSLLTFGFRLNRKNLPGFPGEFEPGIAWSGPLVSARDPGDVSFYQYASTGEIDAIAAMQRRVVDAFIAETRVRPELGQPRSLVELLASVCSEPIRPNHPRWLPYWTEHHVTAWSDLFARSIEGWLTRFVANPETLDAWCRRVLWSKG